MLLNSKLEEKNVKLGEFMGQLQQQVQELEKQNQQLKEQGTKLEEHVHKQDQQMQEYFVREGEGRSARQERSARTTPTVPAEASSEQPQIVIEWTNSNPNTELQAESEHRYEQQ